MKRLMISVLLIAVFPHYTNSQKPTPTPLRATISNGFLTGQEYLDLDTNGKRAYAMGIIDGMVAAPLFLAPQERVEWLSSCIVKMTDEQVVAILTKYLRDNPGEWHHSMNMTSYNAMSGACPRPKH
jgi:hypothetical protein